MLVRLTPIETGCGNVQLKCLPCKIVTSGLCIVDSDDETDSDRAIPIPAPTTVTSEKVDT